MSEKAKNKGRLGGIASVLCFGIIGLGCGISMVPFMTYALEEEGNMFIFLLGVLILFSLMYLSIFIEMAIHEAGHLVLVLPQATSSFPIELDPSLLSRKREE